MEQKKKEYATPKMKDVKLNAHVVLLEASDGNNSRLGLTPAPFDSDHLA